jgi:hypothetical protein
MSARFSRRQGAEVDNTESQLPVARESLHQTTVLRDIGSSRTRSRRQTDPTRHQFDSPPHPILVGANFDNLQ